ncbi:hypothetical protein L4D76_22230 [Photobacterium sagamiensis]|uniref:hypothetical protein n=1 Tax=Photobacterium sagamiensis TaxID=2910241 RepID=UPI003D0A50D8
MLAKIIQPINIGAYCDVVHVNITAIDFRLAVVSNILSSVAFPDLRLTHARRIPLSG